MNFREINTYARQLLRDPNKTIFQEADINNAINEGIDRIRSIPELKIMRRLEAPNEEPEYLPQPYHVLLALFGASRCFFLDEQTTQATMLMNEFEAKMFELRDGIQNGDIEIVDKDGNVIDLEAMYDVEYITDAYYKKKKEIVKDEVVEE